MKIRFIGDVHGKFDKYAELINNCERSIQVGDMGVGFPLKNGNLSTHIAPDSPHLYIRGNHDNPAECLNDLQCLGDGENWNVGDVKFMFCGGAKSIDRDFRVENVDWWSDEEVSPEKMNEIIRDYCEVRPDIMITHDCPEFLPNLDEFIVNTFTRRYNGDRTVSRLGFQRMFDIHKPKLWVFGHWHFNFDKTINGCRFVCLNELQYLDLDISKELDIKDE